jgi:hypothetical protein
MITELVSQKFHNQRAAAIMHAIMSESKLLSRAEKFKITGNDVLKDSSNILSNTAW